MRISLRHGGGGADTAELIREVFERAYGNHALAQGEDSAVLEGAARIALTTDTFVVRPIFFRGGDIGRLAVCGTVNDLLACGARPRYLTAGFVLEEGLELADLSRIAASMAEAAREAGVLIVAGDTKVVEGSGGVFINTSGVGFIEDEPFAARDLCEGDALLLTGTLGDHHACILSHRLGVENDIASDAAPLTGIMDALRSGGVRPRAARDVTRGGLATVLNEWAERSGYGALLEEEAIPVSPAVRGLCGILGMDPLLMGNEGKMLLAVPWEQRDLALALARDARYGENAALIGRVTPERGVRMHTRIGGTRMVAPLVGEGLPRIC